MNFTSKEIVDKYKEFNDFLNKIDLEELEENLNRHELMELRKELRNVSLRSVPVELGKIIDKKKIEEFPQLLGVHHFPIINNIDFLSEEQLIMLDKELLRYRLGDYISHGSLYDIIGSYDEDEKNKLESWLIDNGVLVREYAVVCGHCRDCHISSTMDLEGKETLEKKFNDFKRTDDLDLWEELSIVLGNGCMECDLSDEVDDMEKLHFKSFVKMNMKRDTSLDNV